MNIWKMILESLKAFALIVLLLGGTILVMFLLVFYSELAGQNKDWFALPVVVWIIFLTLKKRRR